MIFVQTRRTKQALAVKASSMLPLPWFVSAKLLQFGILILREAQGTNY